jgi:hypothetical protein
MSAALDRVIGTAMSQNPEQQDNSTEGLLARIEALQAPLGSLIARSVAIFDEIFPHAPDPSEKPTADFPVSAISTLNAEPSRQLNIVIAKDAFVSIHKNPLSLTPSYPLHRLWLWRPEDASSRREIEVLELRRAGRLNSRSSFSSGSRIWENDTNKLLEIVDINCHDQEPVIQEVRQALERARIIALGALGIPASGRLQTQASTIKSETYWGIGIGAPGYLSCEP